MNLKTTNQLYKKMWSLMGNLNFIYSVPDSRHYFHITTENRHIPRLWLQILRYWIKKSRSSQARSTAKFKIHNIDWPWQRLQFFNFPSCTQNKLWQLLLQGAELWYIFLRLHITIGWWKCWASSVKVKKKCLKGGNFAKGGNPLP